MKSSRVLSLLFLGAASHASMVMAQSSGTFTTTGNMTTARFGQTATLLANGMVLFAGGYIRGPAFAKTLSSAELYDPRTGTFTATGNMTTPRSQHSATLLPNGKVLVAGGGITNASGLDDDPTLASAELYDPGTGTFSTTANMTTARFFHTATLLNNGKVLIAGGDQRARGSLDGPRSLASAELYDPSTGTFTATGDMTSDTDTAGTATLLANGKVLITRGTFEFVPPFFAELYDPDTGSFAGTGSTITNHTAPTATLLANGKVLVAGGDVFHFGNDGGSWSTEFTLSAELYDPTQSAFAATGDMTAGRERGTATLLPDGSVLFAGGQSFPRFAVSAQLYDPNKGAFSTIGPMGASHEQLTATLLNSGQVLIAGGDDSAEIYTPPLAIPAPVLLSLSGDGRGPGAILHADTHQVVSSSNPAVAGEALEIYGSGLIDGGVIPPQVAIGGWMAEVLYFGNAPGFAGLNQVNVRVPSGVAPVRAVPVRLTYLGRSSNEVTIEVR